MASRQQIKSRIKSVRNTRQITKAMQLVAAARLRRAQESAYQTRRYAQAAYELLTNLGARIQLAEHPLFKVRPVHARLIIVIASDQGLAGAYDGNILKEYLQVLQAARAENQLTYTIAIGRKAVNFAARLEGVELIGTYVNFPDQPVANDLQPILSRSLELFLDKTVDAVDVIYMHHLSSVVHEVRTAHLLPAGLGKQSPARREIDFEPSAKIVLQTVVRRLVEVQLLQALLEAAASQHSMRMLAMKNATDNATELADDLTLAYNNARQAAITQELAEISGGAEALNT